MNYYSFHIGDYAAHTRRLSLMEDLAYRRLLDEYYLQECPLQGTAEEIARAIGMRDQTAAVEYVLRTYFEELEVGWVNQRCDQELEKSRRALAAHSRGPEAHLASVSTMN